MTSHLQPSTRIYLESYTDSELVSIPKDRVRWGLQPDVISEGQLELIADVAAGDARVAIGILRVAARRATQQNRERIPTDIIRNAVSEAKAEVRQKTEEKLTPDQRFLYNIITDHGPIAPGELYERYQAEADAPKTKRMVRNYLQKLCHYNLVEADGKNRGRTYQPKS